MDALGLLINRRSASRLAEPASMDEQLQNILHVGIHTPGHKSMQPWHFFVTEGGGRERFSAVLEQGVIAADSDDKAIDKTRNTPFRAPFIITVMAKCEKDHKVPRWEQEMSAGCAVVAMQMAAVAQGFGGVWHNGALTESPIVCEASGCREQDKTVGFLHLGTSQLKASTSVNILDPAPFVTCF